LRYGLQFAEALLPSSRLKPYRKKLAVVQDILGDMNDLVVGFARFEQMRDVQPSAWFACGWIRSRLETLTQEAAGAFVELSRAKRFWR
jgi:CHAD domain-containing protein